MVFYVFVTGGVMSGIGKGTVSASIGKILKSKGFNVTAIKIDPYLNFDAGTLRPTEHGEVFVTEDGGETDEDLGHYERFLDITLTKDHNITTGKIYLSVIEKERRGEYLGKTVEAIPHLTDEIKARIKEIARRDDADFVIVEIGGTVGEYQNEIYYRAARLMKSEGEKTVFVHVVYLPILRHLGEMKTKPAQQSVELLGRLGIQPDFIVARAEKEIDEVRRKKLSIFCNIKEEDIISAPDLEYTYELPLVFERQDFGNKILRKLGLESRKSNLEDWEEFVRRLKYSTKKVKIAIVGKYFDIGEFEIGDSYISVIEAIKHASANNEVKAEIHLINSKDFERDNKKVEILMEFDGIIVPGGFGASGVEGKILAIKFARENSIPFLGLCYGFQLAVVEFARNVCGLREAHTTEVNLNTPHPVVDLLPWQKALIKEKKIGATMRLGGQIVRIKRDTLAYNLYKKEEVMERFRHRYEVNPSYINVLEKNGFVFSGFSKIEENIVQIGELPSHKFFIGTQFHPEFTSRPLRPNPIFNGFIKACIKNGNY
ncbi:MAG: CTP synthase [Candidatus Aenigmarchaeota archaeon]|nr:CTP synthase [Candidatus Aenigmarchaeota archaeon]